jgi:hypothetical protein
MGETYQKGRTAGVTGTYGSPRKGVAERTVIAEGENVGGGEGDLGEKAASIYDKAVRNGGGMDTGGDPALRQR